MLDSSPGLLDILRSALQRLEEDPGSANDPAVFEFKRRILRSIAELELSRKSLKAPDVIIPDYSSKAPAAPSPGLAPHPPPAPDASSAPAAPAADSVTVLVTHRSRKPRDNNDGGQSSAV